MDICVRRLGLHRGAPRLYLDTPALSRAGFLPGASIRVRSDVENARVVVETCDDGDRRVSRKTRGVASRMVPVIDLNSQTELEPVAGFGVVRVVFLQGVIHILATACHARSHERAVRLRQRLREGQPLRCASIAFGSGITSWALNEGLEAAGVRSTLCLANEIDGDLVDHGTRVHPLIGEDTVVVNAPMQDAVADTWLLQRVGRVDLLEAGIPCSGASRAGVSKRGLKRMEDHPLVGHLVAAVIQWIAALQPAVFFAENVPEYQHTASASILRAWLGDAGYVVHEAVLDATAFGSLEGRRRWFLMAGPATLPLQLHDLTPGVLSAGSLEALLDAVPSDDPCWRPVGYLKSKERRDADKGSGFSMQWLTPESTRVPTLRKGYHKGGSTDPRLLHPFDPALSRLLTPAEHARIKGVPEQLISGLSATASHEALGQAVDTRPVRALGHWLGRALVSMAEPKLGQLMATAALDSISA